MLYLNNVILHHIITGAQCFIWGTDVEMSNYKMVILKKMKCKWNQIQFLHWLRKSSKQSVCLLIQYPVFWKHSSVNIYTHIYICIAASSKDNIEFHCEIQSPVAYLSSNSLAYPDSKFRCPTLAQCGSCPLHVGPTWAQRALLSG